MLMNGMQNNAHANNNWFDILIKDVSFSNSII